METRITVQTNEGMDEEFILTPHDEELERLCDILRRGSYSDGEVWRIPSAADPYTQWEVRQTEQGVLTCTCPAFHFHTPPCKHIRLIEHLARAYTWDEHPTGWWAGVCVETGFYVEVDPPKLGDGPTIYRATFREWRFKFHHRFPKWLAHRILFGGAKR